jgi:hypothetical protein
VDESTNISDTALLLIFIKGIDGDYNVTEELGCLRPTKVSTTGEDLFSDLNHCLATLNLTFAKLWTITADESPNMLG